MAFFYERCRGNRNTVQPDHSNTLYQIVGLYCDKPLYFSLIYTPDTNASHKLKPFLSFLSIAGCSDNHRVRVLAVPLLLVTQVQFSQYTHSIYRWWYPLYPFHPSPRWVLRILYIFPSLERYPCSASEIDETLYLDCGESLASNFGKVKLKHRL